MNNRLLKINRLTIIINKYMNLQKYNYQLLTLRHNNFFRHCTGYTLSRLYPAHACYSLWIFTPQKATRLPRARSMSRRRAGAHGATLAAVDKNKNANVAFYYFYNYYFILLLLLFWLNCSYSWPCPPYTIYLQLRAPYYTKGSGARERERVKEGKSNEIRNRFYAQTRGGGKRGWRQHVGVKQCSDICIFMRSRREGEGWLENRMEHD